MNAKKLLSIIIPTYNMVELLPRCLESLATSEYAADWLQAIVVNDGSKDDSLAVARQWENRYPQVVTVIDKPNGNYGSTINAALPVALGKYVKILDSDDWFDTAALDKFLLHIQQLEIDGQQVDVINTHFRQLYAGGRFEVVRYNTMGREPFVYGRIYSLDEVLDSGYVRSFLMHGLTYRTQMLRDMDYHQTEGISYTDTEWSVFPIYQARTILFLDLILYQYNMDREGQTMDPNVVQRSLPQMERVNDSLFAYYELHLPELSVSRAAFMKRYHEHRLRCFYKLFLLDMPREMFRAEQLLLVDAKYAELVVRNSFSFDLYPENKLLRIDYIRYWHKYHKRWPLWFERFNHFVDIVVKWLYVHLFRR